MDDEKRVPMGIALCARIFYFLGFGAVVMILGVMFGGSLGEINGPGVVQQSLLLLTIGVGYLASAYGLERGKNWGVYLGVVLGFGLSALYVPIVFNPEFSLVRMVFS